MALEWKLMEHDAYYYTRVLNSLFSFLEECIQIFLQKSPVLIKQPTKTNSIVK